MSNKFSGSSESVKPEEVGPKSIKSKVEKGSFVPMLLILIISLVVFYALLSWTVDLRFKIVIILVELIGTTYLVKTLFHFDTELGMILYRTKIGLVLIKDLSRFEAFWTYFADIGLFLTYGLASFRMFKMNHKWWKVLLSGFIILAVIIVVIAPISQYIIMKSADLGVKNVSSKASTTAPAGVASTAAHSMSLFQYAILALILLGGIFIAGMLGLVMKSFEIISNIFAHYTGHLSVHATPGATLILPGVNLPLFEGALALLVVMVIHEGSHGVLAVLRKIKVKSTGIVLFGFLPVGAFVEPDDNELMKAKSKYKSDVFVAGPTANLIGAVLLLIIHLVLLFSLGNFYITNPIMHFIRVTLGLAIALNFIVGMINLLPIPFFDGYHLLEEGLGKQWTDYFMYISVIGIIIAFLPWFI